MMDDALRSAAKRVIDACIARKLTVVTAESCTGGLVAGALTEIAGSSAVVISGFVTYSNEAKERMLGVPSAVLMQWGAVSRQTARAMADGALARAPVDLTVAITGIAGPGGGWVEKPVGLVRLAGTSKAGAKVEREQRYGNIGRAEVRRRSVLAALAILNDLALGYAVP